MMLQSILLIMIFLIFQSGFTGEKKTIPIEHDTPCMQLKIVLCAWPQSHIFLEPPPNFSPQIQVSGCVCEYQDKMLLLLRNPAKPQGNTWCIPGGKLEAGETSMQAVIREVWEETGLPLQPESLTYCLKVYVRFPDKDFILHLFRAELSSISKTFKISTEEHSGYRWVSLEDALKMPMIPGGSACLQLAFLTPEP